MNMAIGEKCYRKVTATDKIRSSMTLHSIASIINE